LNDLENKQGSSFQKRVRAFVCALQGIKTLLTSECHARFHALAALVAITLGFSLRLSATEWCIVIFAITIVFVCEAFNTAIEFLTDRISLEHHPLSGKAKDVAAGAVLVAAIGAAATGAIIFAPKIWNLFL
jgi:diacylglycerol kinase (ATP)